MNRGGKDSGPGGQPVKTPVARRNTSHTLSRDEDCPLEGETRDSASQRHLAYSSYDTP